MFRSKLALKVIGFRNWKRMAAIVVTLCVVSVIGPASADEDIDDLRDNREETQRRSAEVASQLDSLAADDQELVDAIAALDAFIAAQEEKIAAAERAIAAAELEAQQARDEAVLIGQNMDVIRARLKERAIEAYVRPGEGDEQQLLAADLSLGARRKYLLTEVVGDELDIADDLREAVAKQQDAERRAVSAEEAARVTRGEQADRLIELEDARAEQAQIQAELQRRIASFESEAQELEAADKAMEAEIQAIEAELAAQAERQRLAAVEAERVRAEAAVAALAAEEARKNAEPDGLEVVDDPSDPDTPTTTSPPLPQPPSDGSFAITTRPVPGSIRSSYGYRIHPIYGTSRLHTGIDMDGRSGDPIKAAAAGTVISSGWRGGYGNAVVISHGNGYTTLYAHMSSIGVSAGASVSSGDVIGKIGSTGASTGPHLHFEVRINGATVDPARYL